MNGITIFKSNYGATKTYAQWIEEATGFKAVDIGQLKKKDIINIDTVVIGCPVFAGKPLLGRWIEKNWSSLEGKKVALYTTSGARADDTSLEEVFDSSFSARIRDSLSYFPQSGRMIFSEMSPLHRFFMKLGQKMEKDPQVKKEMLKDKDNMDREGLKALIAYLQK
ncbi:MAG: hypothetical protein GY760_20225 [Deltaproteobacteria bacterium]|nr:hypothetical protein [Deltaproteobacteria bacterium]